MLIATSKYLALGRANGSLVGQIAQAALEKPSRGCDHCRATEDDIDLVATSPLDVMRLTGRHQFGGDGAALLAGQRHHGQGAEPLGEFVEMVMEDLERRRLQIRPAIHASILGLVLEDWVSGSSARPTKRPSRSAREAMWE